MRHRKGQTDQGKAEDHVSAVTNEHTPNPLVYASALGSSAMLARQASIAAGNWPSWYSTTPRLNHPPEVGLAPTLSVYRLRAFCRSPSSRARVPSSSSVWACASCVSPAEGVSGGVAYAGGQLVPEDERLHREKAGTRDDARGVAGATRAMATLGLAFGRVRRATRANRDMLLLVDSVEPLGRRNNLSSPIPPIADLAPGYLAPHSRETRRLQAAAMTATCLLMSWASFLSSFVCFNLTILAQLPGAAARTLPDECTALLAPLADDPQPRISLLAALAARPAMSSPPQEDQPLLPPGAHLTAAASRSKLQARRYLTQPEGPPSPKSEKARGKQRAVDTSDEDEPALPKAKGKARKAEAGRAVTVIFSNEEAGGNLEVWVEDGESVGHVKENVSGAM